ncbi:MAG: TfuA-like protein [Actinomycetota bacterium]
MNVVVFLGPSLDLDTARRHLPDATFLPPAGQFDLISAARRYAPRVIGLIDGYFHQQMAVWHKEILVALSEGIYVFGASSMGAMRAAELAPYGMRGIGQVYDWYQSGTVDRDDEVAIVHSDADSGYRPLSEPMVNIRATIDDARTGGVIDSRDGDRLVEAGLALPYADRTIRTVVRQAIADGLDPHNAERFERFATDAPRDVKRDDAIALLDTIAQLDPDLAPFESDFELQRPHVLHAALERDINLDHDGHNVTPAELAYHAALHRPDFNAFNFNSLNRAIVLQFFDMLDLELDATAIEGEHRRFRTAHELGDDEAFNSWLAANHLVAEEFDALMVDMAKCRRMQQWLITNRNYRGTAQEIVNGLRLANEYVDNADSFVRQAQLVDGDIYGHARERMGAVGLRDMVLEHLRATSCRMSVDYRIWMWEAGFADEESFAVELERSRRSRLATRTILDTLISAVDDETTERRAATRTWSSRPCLTIRDYGRRRGGRPVRTRRATLVPRGTDRPRADRPPADGLVARRHQRRRRRVDAAARRTRHRPRAVHADAVRRGSGA